LLLNKCAVEAIPYAMNAALGISVLGINDGP